MIRRTLSEIAEMAGGRLLQGAGEAEVAGVFTDTRTEMTGGLFVPLVGERFDAHEFLEQAVSQGAAAALWQEDHPVPKSPLPLIGVPDTLAALQGLGAAYRAQLDVLVVGVTGSNGKTSTKDMVSAVLAKKFRVIKTRGNMNNHIGLPLMLLSLEAETEVAVLEMGMNHRHEIELLAKLARPDIGVITNVGEAHIEYLGSREGIADAKCELIEQLSGEGLAFLNGDEPLLRERAGITQARISWFGFKDGNDLQALAVENLGLEGSAFGVTGLDGRFRLAVPGQHQIGNALAAIGVGLALGMTEAEVGEGLAEARLTARRFELHEAKLGGTIIDDAYNAGPTSMRAGLQMLADMEANRYKVAVLGGMLELGPESQQMHREVGAYAAGLPIDLLVTVGELGRWIAAGAREAGCAPHRIFEAEEKPHAVAHLEAVLRDHANDGEGGAIVLVKGSLGTKLVEVVRALIQASV